MESVFVAYFQAKPLCYDKNQLGMCVMGRKTYWVGGNSKYKKKFSLENEPVILDLLEDQDDRVCLQYDRTFCFSRNKEGVGPENKIRQVSQELKRPSEAWQLKSKG